MNISPVTNNYLKSNPVKFTGKDEEEWRDLVFQCDKVKGENLLKGMGIGTGFTLVGVIAGLITKAGLKNSETEDFVNKVQTVSVSRDINQNKFTIEDMTNDKKPDLILYKKDGSKVVIDMANQKILQETKSLDIIE